MYFSGIFLTCRCVKALITCMQNSSAFFSTMNRFISQ
jgi:hypothetical protein